MVLPSLEEVRAEMARRSLAEFVRQAWPVIEPSTTLVWSWHLDVVCDHVQALLEGRLKKRNLIINIPPGSMKSTIISVCAPAWIWAQKNNPHKPDLGPGWRGLFAAGNEGLATRDSIKCRDILESDWYQNAFKPDWTLSSDQNVKGYYKNTKMGFRRAFSSGANVTGDRGHGIFVDDPLDAKKAFNKKFRENVWSWWTQAFANRLCDLRTGTRCVIMQRLHEDDLVGKLKKLEPLGWEVLLIRQEAEPDAKDAPPPTSLGWEDHRTEKGALMFPERFPEEVLEEEKIRMGSAGYAAQHQGRPAPASGNIFKRHWFEEYALDPDAMAKQCQRIVQSWDFASKKGEENDYTCCTTWGIRKNGYYLLDVWLEKVEFPEAKKMMKALAAKWKPSAILAEDTSSGIGLCQELRRESSLPILPIKPGAMSKEERARMASPTVEAGNIHLPAAAPWRADFIEEMCVFPAGAHDDAVDTTSQFINWANVNSSTGEIRLGGARVSPNASNYVKSY